MIVFFLVGQLGCAYTPRHPCKEMTARSAKESGATSSAADPQGLRIAKETTKGLVVGMGAGALIGAAAGVLAGAALTAGTGGIGIVAAPYLIVGGAAVGAGIGGLSGGIAGGANSASTSEPGGTVYDTWKGIRFIQVDSLQPVLQWKPFPTAKDVKTEELSRVTEVTYELMILRPQDSVQGDVVYSRKGLQESSHKVEGRLTPLTRYYWRVRVRFKLDDDYRETKWMHGPPFYTTM